MSAPPDCWTVAILTRRESWHELRLSIEAAMAGTAPPRSVEVIVNGNPGLAEAAIAWLGQQAVPAHRIRVWSIALGDKANAWNTLVHQIAPSKGGCFFLDGYVRVQPDALQAMEDASRAHPACLAVAAVPSMGRSAARIRDAMLSAGGLHGNLFALTASTMASLRDRDIRLPVGMYRTDATLGAMLSFGLVPSRHEWSPLQHICVAPQATWSVPESTWTNARYLHTHWKRLRRQAGGHLENMAVRHHLAVKRRRPEALGRSIAEVVEIWKCEAPDDFRRALGLHPLRWLERNGWPVGGTAAAAVGRHGGALLLRDRP